MMTMRATLVWCRMEAIFSYCLGVETKTMLASECCSRYTHCSASLGRVDGDVNCAQQQGGEVSDRPLRAVLAEDGDAIALANPPSLQLARGSEDLRLQLGGGNRLSTRLTRASA